MKEFIWRRIARLASWWPVFNLLKRYALNHPYYHLPEYMERWWLVPFHWHLPFAIRLHHILREDVDTHLHDHPWNWRTIILQGAYVEEDAFGLIAPRLQGDTNYRTAETMHRILAIGDAVELWTLFITYKKRNRWGFMVGEPPRKIYHRDYKPAVPRHGDTP